MHFIFPGLHPRHDSPAVPLWQGTMVLSAQQIHLKLRLNMNSACTISKKSESWIFPDSPCNAWWCLSVFSSQQKAGSSCTRVGWAHPNFKAFLALVKSSAHRSVIICVQVSLSDTHPPVTFLPLDPGPAFLLRLIKTVSTSCMTCLWCTQSSWIRQDKVSKGLQSGPLLVLNRLWAWWLTWEIHWWTLSLFSMIF